MTQVQARTNRPDARDDAGRGTGSPPGAARPRWLTLGLAAALGAVAGATLFATEAQGRAEARRRPGRR